MCVLVVTLLIHKTLLTLTMKAQQRRRSGSMFRFLTLPSRDLSISLHPFILGQGRAALEHGCEGKTNCEVMSSDWYVTIDGFYKK